MEVQTRAREKYESPNVNKKQFVEMSQLTDFLTHALKSVIFFYNYFSSRKLYSTTGRESCGWLLLLFVWKKG
jgi:hypothetical protein